MKCQLTSSLQAKILPPLPPPALSSAELDSGVVQKQRLRQLVKMAKKEEDQKKFKCGDICQAGLIFWAKSQWVTRPIFEKRKKQKIDLRRKNGMKTQEEYWLHKKQIRMDIISKGYKRGDVCKENGKIVVHVNAEKGKIFFATKEKWIEYKLRKAELQKHDKISGKSKMKTRKRMENPLERMKSNFRKRTRDILKSNGWRKSKKSEQVVGCDWEYFKKYIESKFKDGMTWDNMGKWGWHLDHIIPLSSAQNDNEVLKLCHYSNIQPLWWTDNLAKGCKII